MNRQVRVRDVDIRGSLLVNLDVAVGVEVLLSHGTVYPLSFPTIIVGIEPAAFASGSRLVASDHLGS